MKIVKKKQKHKGGRGEEGEVGEGEMGRVVPCKSKHVAGGRGKSRTMQKTVPNKSFFNSFSLPDGMLAFEYHCVLSFTFIHIYFCPFFFFFLDVASKEVVSLDSFLLINCFDVVSLSTQKPEDDDAAVQLSDDFARAEFLRDRLIPKAVLFFTGEALEEDDDMQEVWFAVMTIIMYVMIMFVMCMCVCVCVCVCVV